MTLGDLIKKHCKEHGITFARFARECGVTRGYIHMLVYNQNNKTGKPIVPTVKTCKKMADVMGMTVDDILCETDFEAAFDSESDTASINERLTAIADALETASKQMRLLAEEVGRPVEVTTSQIAVSTELLNRIAGASTMRGNLQEFQR